jgi:protocatechuate 3,4-dioxygenase alpha subunit
MSKLIPTAELTLGPFFPPQYIDAGASDLTVLEGRQACGEAIEIHGRVTQEDGTPTDSLVLEIWQADAGGIFRHPADPRYGNADANFLGWGRAATSMAGDYRFRTIKPGAYAMPDGKLRAPHINVLILFSGLMRQLQTVIFFAGEAANETDLVLTAVQPAAVRSRLVARRDGSGRYRFDVRLRGEGETPFFQD